MNYVPYKEAMAAQKAVIVELEDTDPISDWREVWITVILPSQSEADGSEIRFDARGEKMTVAGAKQRAEELAVRHGISVICLRNKNEDESGNVAEGAAKGAGLLALNQLLAVGLNPALIDGNSKIIAAFLLGIFNGYMDAYGVDDGSASEVLPIFVATQQGATIIDKSILEMCAMLAELSDDDSMDTFVEAGWVLAGKVIDGEKHSPYTLMRLIQGH